MRGQPSPYSGDQPYFIPEAAGAPAVNVLPTERLMEIVQSHRRLEEALIEIATAFDARVSLPPACRWCGHPMWAVSCLDWCPGLLARRALGVA